MCCACARATCSRRRERAHTKKKGPCSAPRALKPRQRQFADDGAAFSGDRRAHALAHQVVRRSGSRCGCSSAAPSLFDLASRCAQERSETTQSRCLARSQTGAKTPQNRPKHGRVPRGGRAADADRRPARTTSHDTPPHTPARNKRPHTRRHCTLAPSNKCALAGEQTRPESACAHPVFGKRERHELCLGAGRRIGGENECKQSG